MDISEPNNIGEVPRRLTLSDREKFYLGELTEAERAKYLAILKEDPDRFREGDEWLDEKFSEFHGIPKSALGE